MILKRLFNPLRRRQDNAATPPDPGTHADPGVRRQACKQSTDLSALQKTAWEDPDAGVRDYALARLRKLLTGNDPVTPPVAERMDCLRNTENPALAAHLATHADEPELRRLAIGMTLDPQVLADCALGDPIAALRLAATECLQDKTALNRVVQQIGKKDKKVLRSVRDKLKAIAEAEAAPQRLRVELEDLCARAERLGRSGVWRQDRALADHIRAQWQALGPETVPAELVTRFSGATDAFDQAYAAYAAKQESQHALSVEQAQRARECKALLEELGELEANDESETRLADISQRWTSLGGADSGLQQDFLALADKLREAIDRRHGLAQRDERLTRHIKKGEALVNRSASLSRKDLLRWREQGEKLCATQAGDSLAQAFSDLMARIDRRMDKQHRHALQKLEQLPERLALLKAELDEGVLRKATALHQSLHADLDLIGHSGLPHKDYMAAEREYKQITPRLRELQQWRKWGTDQHRQEMCAAMDALWSTDLPLEEVHDRLQVLQAEWKQLDHGGSPVNEGLWKRFHQSADQVYGRCGPYLEELAHAREANRRERENLCQQLEKFLDQADWSSMDWKRAGRAEREIRTAWGNIGPVDAKQRKSLDKRYHKAMKRLDIQLSKERARNKALKSDLIERAKQLIEEPNLVNALHEVKQLQRQWQTTVANRRKQENQMWRHFREACDQVYERRNTMQNAHNDELKTNAAIRVSLCEELENSVASSPSDADKPRDHLHKLQGRWAESMDLELARTTQARLDKRWNAGVLKLKQHIQSLRQRTEREQLNRLRDLAVLCQELEARVESAPMANADRDAWRRRFAALPTPETEDWREDITLRFETALDASTEGPVRQDWLDSLPDNVAHREYLCLQLEVFAGADSPPEASEARLAFQVSRLSGHLAEGAADNLDTAQGLVQAWYLGGPVQAVYIDRLRDRFERALSASRQVQAARADTRSQDGG